jgi:hypothetical protein
MDPHQQHMGPYGEGTLSYLGRLPELLLYPRSEGELDRARSREIQHASSIQSVHDRRFSYDGRYDHLSDVIAERVCVRTLHRIT